MTGRARRRRRKWGDRDRRARAVDGRLRGEHKGPSGRRAGWPRAGTRSTRTPYPRGERTALHRLRPRANRRHGTELRRMRGRPDAVSRLLQDSSGARQQDSYVEELTAVGTVDEEWPVPESVSRRRRPRYVQRLPVPGFQIKLDQGRRVTATFLFRRRWLPVDFRS